MTLLDEFKNIVDTTDTTIDGSFDLDRLYQHYEIAYTNGQSRKEVIDFLYGNVKERLNYSDDANENDIVKKSRFFKLEQELVYEHILFGFDSKSYLKIIERIKDATRTNNINYPSLNNQELWKSAVINVKDYYIVSAEHHSEFNDIYQHYNKEIHVANSYKYLKEQGCEIEIVDSELSVKSGIDNVVDTLDNLIKTVGGKKLASIIFRNLENRKIYSSELQRYLIARDTTLGGDKHKPETPWGYLLNKCVKFANEEKPVNDLEKLLKEIQEISTHLSVSLYKAETYSTWEYVFKTGENLIEFLNELVLWDSIYTVPQCRADIAIKLNEYIFGYINEADFLKYCGFTISEFQEVSKAILLDSDILSSPNIIYHSAISKKLRHIDANTILQILNLLSHNSGEANKNYTLPDEYIEINFGFNPLLKLGNTKFLLMNKSWCSSAFFETVATALRLDGKGLPQFDSKIGYALEHAMSKLLNKHNITSNSGDYDVEEIHGECDFAIECEKSIILIELKKKVLTRTSKSGGVANILIDLADSLLESYLQATQTEIFLRQKGEVELIKGDKQYLLKREGRTIEKISLTHLDYGGLQNRTVIERILIALTTHNYSTTDEALQKKFNALSEKQKRLVSQIKTLQEIEGDFYKDRPFFNCHFMSISQLYHIIENSNGNDSFNEILSKTKYVSLGTYDFYKEFLYQYVMQKGNKDSTIQV